MSLIYMIKDKKEWEEQKMLNGNKEKGITLIALVVTIIVLLILAAVSLAMLTGENGIINNAKSASENTKIENYSEQIKLLINDEIIERSYKNKEDPFIKSLKDKIEAIDWVSYVVMIDDTGEENEDFQKSNQLVIGTIDNYELMVEVDNDRLIAEIVSKEKVGDSNYEISYWEEGKEEKVQIRKRASIKLKDCNTLKEGYSFIGWCLNREGEGEVYQAQSLYKPNGNIILYAIFGKNIHFDANGGIGEIEDLVIRVGKNVMLSQSINITNSGLKFKEWNSKADGSGISYPENESVVIDENVTTLYAIWRWDNNNWDVFWKQQNVAIAKVNDEGDFEMEATSNAYCWLEIGTREAISLKDIKQIKLTMDFPRGILGIITYKDNMGPLNASDMTKSVNVSSVAKDGVAVLDVSTITDDQKYYIVLRINPNPTKCKVKNLEFIY